MVVSITRTEIIAGKIRQTIQNGGFVSGERLVELTLAQHLQVSQNTIRDALRLLEVEGWVVKHARYGAYVRSFSPEEAAELYALWAVLESLALSWVMETITRKDLLQLKHVIQDARKQAQNGDMQTVIDTDLKFHALIGEMSGKPQTAQLLASLRNRVYLLEVMRQFRAPRSLHSHEARLLLYEKLVSLMEAEDTAGAKALLEYLITSERDSLLPLLG